MGYVLGKPEGAGQLWHGHVSAVSVNPEYRRLGLVQNLMDLFEEICEKTHNAYFLFENRMLLQLACMRNLDTQFIEHYGITNRGYADSTRNKKIIFSC